MATISAGDIYLGSSFSVGSNQQNTYSRTSTIFLNLPPTGHNFIYFNPSSSFYNIFVEIPDSVKTAIGSNRVSSIQVDLRNMGVSHNAEENNGAGNFYIKNGLRIVDDGDPSISDYDQLPTIGSNDFEDGSVNVDENETIDEFGEMTMNNLHDVHLKDTIFDTTPSSTTGDFAAGRLTDWDGRFDSGYDYYVDIEPRSILTAAINFGFEQMDITINSVEDNNAQLTKSTTFQLSANFLTESELTRAFVGSTTYPLSTAFNTNLNTLQQTHQEDSDQFDISTNFNQTALGGFQLEGVADIDPAFDLTNTGPAGIVFAGESALDLVFSSTFSGVIATTGESDTAFDTTVALDPDNTGVLHTTPSVISTAITLENTGLAGRIRTGFTIDPQTQFDLADLANNQVFLLQQPPDNFVYTTPGYTRTITIPLEGENRAHERHLYIDQQTRTIEIPLQGEDRAHERHLYIKSQTRTIPAEALDQ